MNAEWPVLQEHSALYEKGFQMFLFFELLVRGKICGWGIIVSCPKKHWVEEIGWLGTFRTPQSVPMYHKGMLVFDVCAQLLLFTCESPSALSTGPIMPAKLP